MAFTRVLAHALLSTSRVRYWGNLTEEELENRPWITLTTLNLTTAKVALRRTIGTGKSSLS